MYAQTIEVKITGLIGPVLPGKIMVFWNVNAFCLLMLTQLFLNTLTMKKKHHGMNEIHERMFDGKLAVVHSIKVEENPKHDMDRFKKLHTFIEEANFVENGLGKFYSM